MLPSRPAMEPSCTVLFSRVQGGMRRRTASTSLDPRSSSTTCRSCSSRLLQLKEVKPVIATSAPCTRCRRGSGHPLKDLCSPPI
mmetsp:Transcript_44391/g.115376  ORF Transcript_44391/g.115376 Transcript_44391/m.115376 type:complete len:84 (+) Transcript_44391:1729-1980(+)